MTSTSFGGLEVKMENIAIANSRASAWRLIAKAPSAARGRRGYADPVRGDGGLRYRSCLPPPVG